MTSNKMKRSMATLFLVLVAIFLTIGTNLYFFSLAPAPNQEEQTLHISRGLQLPEILDMLKGIDVIRDKTLFKYYLIFRGMTTQVRAGDYNFPARITPQKLAQELKHGDFKTYRARIVEGWNIREVAYYLERMGFTQKDQFLARCRDKELMTTFGIEGLTLEGYLFPDTYEMYRSVSDDEMIARFVGQFKKVFTDDLKKRADELHLSVPEIMTIASIVEKETGRKSEQKIVASVIYNRLKKGIPLAMDPTVIYGVPNFNGNLTRMHLMTPTPYNTYLFSGLPPGPIANPSLSAIKAALYPDTTRYLYFVAKGNGYHHFSETLEEHNQSVRKYQMHGG